MPLEFDDPDGDGNVRPATGRFGDRFGKSKRPWWRPASTVGRVFLSAGALLVLGAFTTACLLVRHSLERDARFRIAGTEDIQATGLTEVSRSEMMPVFGEDIGRNIFFVPIDQRRRALEQIPWIERATVMRVLPDQIRVAVVERQPVAFTRHGEQIGLVDANGVLLGMAPATMAKHHYSFPVLTGIDAGDSADSRKARMDVYLRMMAELDADGKHNSEQISEIDLTDPEDARVLMPEQGADVLAHFGEDHFLERYERYQAHIAEWRQQYPHLAAVDLRYDNQVVLEMASGKETAETANGDALAPSATPNPDAKCQTRNPRARKIGRETVRHETGGHENIEHETIGRENVRRENVNICAEQEQARAGQEARGASEAGGRRRAQRSRTPLPRHVRQRPTREATAAPRVVSAAIVTQGG
jgi:cell division protein FtsQ